MREIKQIKFLKNNKFNYNKFIIFFTYNNLWELMIFLELHL